MHDAVFYHLKIIKNHGAAQYKLRLFNLIYGECEKVLSSSCDKFFFWYQDKTEAMSY